MVLEVQSPQSYSQNDLGYELFKFLPFPPSPLTPPPPQPRWEDEGHSDQKWHLGIYISTNVPGHSDI